MAEYPDPCPLTGRRRVTVEQWANRPESLCDEYAYWFNAPEAEVGLDPWRLIEGIDPRTKDDQYDVCFASGKYRTTPGDTVIYIAAKHYAVLCAAMHEPANQEAATRKDAGQAPTAIFTPDCAAPLPDDVAAMLKVLQSPSESLSRAEDAKAEAADILEAMARELAAVKAERDALKTVPMKYRRMRFNAQLQDENEKLREDAERLDWWIKHTDAVICNGGAYGPYHVMFRYSNRTAPEANTPRAAIDAAMKEVK